MGFNAATGLQEGIEHRNEFRAERELTVARMPARGENDQGPFSDCHLDNRRVAFIETCDNFCVCEPIRLELAMFPEMDLGEIVEARIIEWGEHRVSEID